MDEPIRVLLADDHPPTRQGVRAVLESAPDIDVVGEAGDGVEAKKLVAELGPDILLLDLIMPGPKPADIERWVRHNRPETITLILTAHDRDALLAEMEAAGAAGFLTKDEDPPALVAAIRRAAQGEALYTPEQLERVHRWREEVGQRWESLTETRAGGAMFGGGVSNRRRDCHGAMYQREDDRASRESYFG